jgi:cell wall-associated NlpC family hydrolase
MRRAWLARTALVLLPALTGALAGVIMQPSPAYLTQPPPAYPAQQVSQALQQSPATAYLTASTASIGNRILNVAETRKGSWYVFGADGPSTFDCSGLVYWAAQRLGVNMPRDTFEMLNQGVSSGLLYRVSVPRRGDLAFFGTGHVEFVTIWPDTTFGAQNTGTRVGWHTWNAWWHPTMFYRIR